MVAWPVMGETLEVRYLKQIEVDVQRLRRLCGGIICFLAREEFEPEESFA